MTRALLSMACHAYGAAAVVYLIFLVRQAKGLAVAGRILVGLGLLLHGASVGLLLTEQAGRLSGISQGLSILSLLLLAIFLALDLAYRRPVIGAFVTPLALAILVPAFMVPGGPSAFSPGLHGPLLSAHIAIALLGVASFAVAAGVGVMYLLMEREVKGKEFGLLFDRLPPLRLLDDLNRRLVLVGFIALSVTVATGAFFARGPLLAEPKVLVALVGWGLFAAVLNARHFAGWQGKRVAVLTMAGFGLLLISFLSSYPLGVGR
jgi:ABC-type uncharacterized transport system permease subunit